MGEDKDQEPLILEMEAYDGELVKVKIVDTFEDNGKTYVVADDLNDEESSYLFEVQHTDEGDALVSVEEDEFERLAKILENL